MVAAESGGSFINFYSNTALSLDFRITDVGGAAYYFDGGIPGGLGIEAAPANIQGAVAGDTGIAGLRIGCFDALEVAAADVQSAAGPVLDCSAVAGGNIDEIAAFDTQRAVVVDKAVGAGVAVGDATPAGGDDGKNAVVADPSGPAAGESEGLVAKVQGELCALGDGECIRHGHVTGQAYSPAGRQFRQGSRKTCHGGAFAAVVCIVADGTDVYELLELKALGSAQDQQQTERLGLLCQYVALGQGCAERELVFTAAGLQTFKGPAHIQSLLRALSLYGGGQQGLDGLKALLIQGVQPGKIQLALGEIFIPHPGP